jgi:hypothetical protein
MAKFPGVSERQKLKRFDKIDESIYSLLRELGVRGCRLHLASCNLEPSRG